MTPRPRYYALNQAIGQLRGRNYEFHIRGIDELIIRHDSVMLESCNTSFQAHFQTGADEFARLYNIAQLITAPLLAAATNSPLLFGKRLWRETRIALFQQAVDTRRATPYLRESKGRVSFGSQWIDDSVLEIFKEDIARYRVLLGDEIDEDPFSALERGEVPALKALCLHNGTIYRWNRPCYGVSGKKAHLRIENRVLPAGPTIRDSVANAAFFFGLMSGVSDHVGEVSSRIDFGDVRANFLAAAQLGLVAQFSWLDGKTLPAAELICKELLPLARQGLESRGLEAEEVNRYLEVFEERVSRGKTGAHWMLRSLSEMEESGIRGERMAALTAGMVSRQKSESPVHEWTLADLKEGGGWKPNYMRVEQIMTTDLVTVTQNDTLDLVANLMSWEKIRHVPVEDDHHRLVGLISYRAILRFFAEKSDTESSHSIPIEKIMVSDPITVGPETSSLEAIETMKKNKIGSLPVVQGGRLVGIVTERDFMNIARELLEQKLKE